MLLRGFFMWEEAEVGCMKAELLWGKKCKGMKGRDMQVSEATKRIETKYSKKAMLTSQKMFLPFVWPLVVR